MSDLISRQAAIDEIKALYEWHEIVTEDRAVDHFKRLPSAEPERKKGKWRRRLVDDGFNADWHCSKCGWKTSIEEHGYNFCPNCGADMRGGEE